MNTTLYAYAVYVLLCTIATVWVGRVLLRQGMIYVSAGFEDRRILNDAMTHLLIVGFYLINFGVICFVLKTDHEMINAQNAAEALSTKVGAILFTLGLMHFFIMGCFSAIRGSAVTEMQHPPGRQLPVRKNNTEFVELKE